MPFPVTVLLDRDAPSETFIRREIDLLRQRGWELHVRYLIPPPKNHPVNPLNPVNPVKKNSPPSPPLPRLRFMRVALRRTLAMLPRSPLCALRMLKRLPQAAALTRDISETRSRLVWAQFAGITADIAGIAAETAGAPWVCSVHAHDVFTPPPGVLMCRLRDARRVIACSQAAGGALRDSGLPPDRIEIIHHGAPLANTPSTAPDCSRLPPTPPPDGRQAIFSAGRLEPKKGFDTLIRACALLHARGVPVTCRIAGEGGQDDSLRRLADDLGIGGGVVFLGWLPPGQVLDEIRNAGAVALASRRLPDGDRDGIANIILEALAEGAPVVTTTAGGGGEVIQDNVNGRLVPPDDPRALADALADLLAMPEGARQRLATAARQTIAEAFDPIQNIQALEAVFRNIT